MDNPIYENSGMPEENYFEFKIKKEEDKKKFLKEIINYANQKGIKRRKTKINGSGIIISYNFGEMILSIRNDIYTLYSDTIKDKKKTIEDLFKIKL